MSDPPWACLLFYAKDQKMDLIICASISRFARNFTDCIPAESRRMNVGKDVIRVLGSPTYICVLQRKDRKSIAITPCTAEHPMSFKVPDRLLTDGQCRMMINGIQFIQALLEANELAVGKDHQFKGRYEAEKNAVIISLEKDEREW